MCSFRPLIALVALATFATAHAQKSFVAPHAFEQNGVLGGIGWDLTGGQFGINGSSSAGPTTGYDEIDGLFSLFGNAPIYNWLQVNLAGVATPFNCDIYRIVKGPTMVQTVSAMYPSFVSFPACDGDSKDPGGVLCGSIPGLRSEALATRAKEDTNLQVKRQKMWLSSNFRLTIGDLPCGRVSKIEAISVKQKVADVDGDGKLDVVKQTGPLTFYVPAADAPAFQEAMKLSLAGTPKTYVARLEYLDGDGNTILAIQMPIEISSVGPGDIFLNPADPAATFKIRGSSSTKPGFDEGLTMLAK